MAKFTIANLKKQLSQKSKEDLIKEISILCQTFPQVKEYYKAQGSDISEIQRKYKEIIQREFLAEYSRGLPKVRYSVARKAVNDFKKLANDPKLVVDMMLVFVESASDFNNEYAPDGEKFYQSPENMFDASLTFMQKYGLLDFFQRRVYEIAKNASEGWGHRDYLRDRYGEFYGGWE